MGCGIPDGFKGPLRAKARTGFLRPCAVTHRRAVGAVPAALTSRLPSAQLIVQFYGREGPSLGSVLAGP